MWSCPTFSAEEASWQDAKIPIANVETSLVHIYDCQTRQCAFISMRRRGVRWQLFPMKRICPAICLIAPLALAAEPPRTTSQVIERGALPTRVHVFEDYETEIEKRWWLRGTPITDDLAPNLSSIENRRACRASEDGES